ncbi:glutathione S-transferase family protein [Salipiger sp.]|uniref:glutathione S-transferase family protein n=1 Tax=Salipiger sp. TaxID=2078585 RepID=UPI003A97983A
MTTPCDLLFSPTSPFVRKVRVVAAETGTELTHTPATASPLESRAEITAANPLGKVPALRIPGGETLYDSPVICRYLGEGTAVYPTGADGWRALRREALADGLMDAALLARYETALRPEALRWSDWTEGQMGKVANALVAMEADVRTVATPDIGDIATGCALGYLDFRYAALDWRATHPRLADWAEPLLARPSFRDTAPA